MDHQGEGVEEVSTIFCCCNIPTAYSFSIAFKRENKKCLIIGFQNNWSNHQGGGGGGPPFSDDMSWEDGQNFGGPVTGGPPGPPMGGGGGPRGFSGPPSGPADVFAWLDMQHPLLVKRVYFHTKWLLEQHGVPIAENEERKEDGEFNLLPRVLDFTSNRVNYFPFFYALKDRPTLQIGSLEPTPHTLLQIKA